MPALFFTRSEDTVVDGTTDKNSHCLPLVIAQLFSHALHGWGPLESGVCSPWPDKSSIERGVISGAEMASASGERATMEDGKWVHALQKAKAGIHPMKGWYNGMVKSELICDLMKRKKQNRANEKGSVMHNWLIFNVSCRMWNPLLSIILTVMTCSLEAMAAQARGYSHNLLLATLYFCIFTDLDSGKAL